MKTGSSVKNRLNVSLNNLFIFYLIISLSFLSCTSNNNELISISGSTMGTTYSIKIVESPNTLNLHSLKSKIDSVLVEVNQQMSTYIKDSELSLFNTESDTNWKEVSTSLSLLMNDAKEISEETKNYYDITVGPMVNLWGFGPELIPTKIPSDDEINQSRERIGIDKLLIDKNSSRIKKRIPNLYCDLSSIAKGHGVDKVSLFLEKIGQSNYMVEIGGEVRAKGKNNRNEKWKIGISTPLGVGLQKVISITNVSVATSGDYLNYFEKDGIRYSHLINTKTGKPIIHNLASVTVLHKECSFADAYATAINVMGPDEGFEFALEKKLPVFMIVRKGENFMEKMTPQFKEYIEEGK